MPTLKKADNVHEALRVAKRGWPVFPLEPGGKKPLTLHGFKDATTDEAQIRAWWTKWPCANIGIATGQVSGLLVLDIDPRNGGHDALRTLEQTFGALPQTVECLTGGGGSHIYFAYPMDGTPISSGTAKLGPGLDVKADGGYVVAPPSIHPDGGLYTWEVEHHPDDVPLAECPQWLLDELRARENRKANAAAVGEHIPEGRRNDTLTSLAGSMRCRGMSQAAIEAALREENRRCSPPLPDEEVHSIAVSVARYSPARDTPIYPLMYRSRFLGHSCSRSRPDLWVASFDDRRSWANGVRRLLGSKPQWASQPRPSTSSRGLRRGQQVSAHLDW